MGCDAKEKDGKKMMAARIKAMMKTKGMKKGK